MKDLEQSDGLPGPRITSGMPANDRHNTRASFHKMLTDATPLIIPQIGAVYQVLAPAAEALLRAAVGLALVPHGLRLFYGFFPGTGANLGSFAAFSAMLDRGGYRPAAFWAVLVFLTEFVAGPMLAIGLLSRPAALAVSVLMLLSVVEHVKDGYFWNRQGVEYPGLWAIAALYFLANGGGLLSLDHFFGFEF
jgi:putative oxidoreductase